MREERLELSRISALASKTSVATITPLSHVTTYLGGNEWNRTTDLMRMKQLLCLLSYITMVPIERIELP